MLEASPFTPLYKLEEQINYEMGFSLGIKCTCLPWLQGGEQKGVWGGTEATPFSPSAVTSQCLNAITHSSVFLDDREWIDTSLSRFSDPQAKISEQNLIG